MSLDKKLLLILHVITKEIKFNVFTYICSAQSRNRYHSRMALRKVRIPTWLRNSRMVSDHSRIAQGVFSVL